MRRSLLTCLSIFCLCSICIPSSSNVRIANTPAFATFTKNDHVIILVSGDANQSQTFGFSGTGSLFRATGTSASGRLTFSAVSGASNISLERRSGADITNKSNYGENGYIPPGIYFLHYHRFDDSSHQARHRLGLSDRKCGEDIVVQVNNQTVTRSHLQFHVAFNDLEDFHPDVSKGCITLTTQNFFQLFSDNFFGTDSPLPSCGSHQPSNTFTGQGRILVFVTDVITPNAQAAQTQIFQTVVSGNANNGLTSSDFGGGAPSANLTSLRTLWKAGVP